MELRHPEQPAPDAYSVPEFCRSHRISKGLFYILKRAGRAPRTMKAGKRTLIAREAAEDWRRQMETGAA